MMTRRRDIPRYEGAVSYQITRIEAERDRWGEEEVRYIRVAVFADGDEAKAEANRLLREARAADKPVEYVVDLREHISGRWEVIEDAWYSARA